MVRTIVSIPEEIKQWLDQYSRKHHESIAQVIREALEEFRKKEMSKSGKSALMSTAGILKDKIKMDAVDYVRKLREEWD